MTVRASLVLVLLQRRRRTVGELGAALGVDVLGVAFLVHDLAGHGHTVRVRGGHVELVASPR